MSNHALYLFYRVLLNARINLLNIILIRVGQITSLLQFTLDAMFGYGITLKQVIPIKII